MSKPRSKTKATPDYDPAELNDLIHTPAVGSGVSSHLLLRTEDVATVVKSDSATVATRPIYGQAHGSEHPATIATSNMATVDGILSLPLWTTENGHYLTLPRVKRITSEADVLNKAERATVAFLRRRAGTSEYGGGIAQAGYGEIVRGTGLSRKTVQRTVESLIEKEVIAIEKPAEIYHRTPTCYRVSAQSEILSRHEKRGRQFTARVGAGVVYVTPVVKSDLTIGDT